VRLRLLSLLLLAGALAGCGASPYESVSDSALPRIDGVSVVSSQRFEGNDCCETHTGAGVVWLSVAAVSDAVAVRLVAEGFVNAGWESTPCMLDPGYGALPSAAYKDSAACVRRADMFARISDWTPGLAVHHADARVWFERTLDL
jgi:hypothetical protein